MGRTFSMAAGAYKNRLAAKLHPKGCKMPCRDQLWTRGHLFHCWVTDQRLWRKQYGSQSHRRSFRRWDWSFSQSYRMLGSRPSFSPKRTQSSWNSSGSLRKQCKQEVKDSVSVMEVSSVTSREEVHGQRADLVEETGRRISQLPWICWAEWTNRKQEWWYLS